MPSQYGIIIRDGINYSHDTASSISFDNSGGGGILSNNVQDVIEEINNKIPTVVNKVYEENSTGNAPYRVLLSASYDDTSKDDTAKKSSKLRFNPSTGRLDLTGVYYIDRQDGTTTSVGESAIVLGNSTASGTAGNSRGRVFLFGTNNQYVQLETVDTLSGNRTIKLPNASGTLALVPEIINLFSPSSSTPYLTSGQTVQISSHAQSVLNSGRYIAKIAFNYQTDDNSVSRFHSLCTVGRHGICARVRENPSGTLFSYRFNYGSSGVNVTTYGNDVAIYIFEIILYNFNN